MALLFRSKKKTEVPTGSISPNFASTKDVKKWSVGEVCEWLNMQGLANYKNNFAERMINGEDLVDIEERDLDSLKVTKFADRKKLMTAIRSLTSKEVKPFDSGSKVSSASKPTTDSASTHSEEVFDDEIAITVKCYYNEDIRSFDIDSLNFDTLKKKIEEEYQQQFIMKYKDEENELVSLSTTAGLKLAVRSGNVLKLFLYPLQALTVAETKLLDDIVDAVLVIDTNGHMLYVNPATEKMFGYTKKQLLYKNVRMLMTKKDSKKHSSYIERYVETGIAQIIGKGRIVDCKNADGEEFKARLSVNETKKDGKHFFTGTIHKLENDDVANTSVNISSFIILDGFLDPMVVIDEKGVIMFFNKAAEAIFGFSKLEVQGRNVNSLMPEPFKSEHHTYLANYNRSGISKIMGTGRDVPIQKKDGSICMCHLKLNKSDIGGKIYYTGSLSPDVKAKETLSMLEQERLVLKEMLIPAIIIDSRGIIQAFNMAAQKAFGYTTAEMIAKNVSNLMFDEQKEKHDSYLKNHMETGESKIIGVGRKVVVRKKDGSALPCKLFVTKKSDGNATFFTGVLQEYEN